MPVIPEEEYQARKQGRTRRVIPEEEYQASRKKPSVAPEMPSDQPEGQRRNIVELLSDIGTQTFQKATGQPARAMDIYRQEREAGTEALKSLFTPEGREGGLGKAALKTGLGALQYTFSPITGAVEGLIGEPIQETAEHYGASPAVSQFLRGLGTSAAYFTPVGGMIQGARAAKMAPGALGMQRAQEAMKAFPKGLRPDTAEDIARASQPVAQPPILKELTKAATPFPKAPKPFKTILDDKTTANIAKGAEEALTGNLSKSKRLFRQVSDKLAIGEIQADAIPEILKKHNLSPAEFAKMYRETISTSGRNLQTLSRLARRLNTVFKESPEVASAFDKVHKNYLDNLTPGWRAWESIAQGFAGMENYRRGLLVTQVATAMRNMWSQMGRVSIGALDDSLQGLLTGTFGGQGRTLERMKAGFYTPLSMFNRLSSKKRQQLAKVLGENSNAIEKAKLLSAPVHEVTAGGKIAEKLQWLNRWQEHQFRKLAFESKLRQQMALRGKTLENILPDEIPENEIVNAVDYALEMTFAKMPKGAGGEFIRSWSKSPLTLVNPFPKFNFGNALPFLIEHSPVGYLFAMSPSAIKGLASGNPQQFAKAASRATIGSLMMDYALQVRSDPEKAGEKWYELKYKDKTIDTRAYAPMSTYLFIAEVLTNPERLRAMDYTQAAVGLNRIAGTGLVLTDLLRTDKPESSKEVLQRFAGEYAGSFTVPMRTLKDFYAAIDPEEARYRDVREHPLIGPTAGNIPGLSQELPERPSPLRAEPGRTEYPLLRQLAGLSIRTKNALEKEVDRIGFDRARIYPRTGIPEADNLISGVMGPISENVLPKIFESRAYKKETPEMQRVVLAETFKEIRKSASDQIKAQNPDLAAMMRVEGMSDDLKAVLEQKNPELAKILERIGEERKEKRRWKPKKKLGDYLKRETTEIRYGGR
jgi:hypothetical protein